MRDYCSVQLGGVVLDEWIPGYITTNVEGRGFVGRNVIMSTQTGRDGGRLEGVDLMPRVLTIHYLIRTSTSAQAREAEAELHRLLNSKSNLQIQFGDEPGLYYYGVLSEYSEKPYDQTSGEGYFKIYCESPWKYGAWETIVIEDSMLVQREYTSELGSLLFKAKAGNSIKMTNLETGSKITLSDPDGFQAGAMVLVDLTGGTAVIKVDGVSKPEILDIRSDLEGFIVTPQDTLVVTGASECSMTTRKVVL
jgi:predicted phage tail component-like protein